MKCCVKYKDMDTKWVKIPNELQGVKSDISVKTASDCNSSEKNIDLLFVYI